MFCIYCGATLPEGAKKCTLCGNPVVRPPEATAQPVSEPESESAPAPETPTEPAVEDISSNSTESLSEAEPTPEAEDTPSNSPDSEDIYSHSPTDFTEDISSGDALGDKPEGMEHEETVVLLSHKKADSYIHIDVEFGEGEGKIPVDSIAKRAEAYKPKEKVTYKMIKEYIEAKYGFKVHTAYIAEVKRNLGLPMYDAPNAVEELKQPRKHPTPEKVEAIKDALRYFAVI